MYTILVVDDDVSLARTLARKLDRDGRTVLTAPGPAEALKLFAAQRVDVVLSDDQMPGQTGRELLSQVRADHPDTVRILMTGQPSLESALAAFNQQEVYRYLTKPFDVEELRKVIDEALERVNQQRTQRRQADNSDRKQRLLEELNKEHPGLLEVPTGEYQVVAPAGTIEAMLQALLEDRPLPDLALSNNPIQLADELLQIPLIHPRFSVVIEPSAAGHQVMVDAGSRVFSLFVLDSSLGDSIAARLAVIADLDLAAVGQQLGRVSLTSLGGRGEALIALRGSAVGLAVELRRMIQPEEVDSQAPTGRNAAQSYKLLEVIGRGGLGIVYRALHSTLERPVAVKVLRDAIGHDPLAAARLLREARAASRARHPGIVNVLDYGRMPDDRPFIVMELVESPTLDDLLERGALAVDDALYIARNLAVALGAAHEAGVLHRDLKPSNIFVDESLDIKISDFGAAKLLHDAGPALTAEGTTIGTPHYMSPEQARNERVDRRSDIYSLGCVLFEMLSGSPPFEGESSLHVVSQHILADIPTPTSPHGPLPLPLSRAIKRAMAKNPAERHQNTAELLADFEQAAAALRRTGWRRWLP